MIEMNECSSVSEIGIIKELIHSKNSFFMLFQDRKKINSIFQHSFLFLNLFFHSHNSLNRSNKQRYKNKNVERKFFSKIWRFSVQTCITSLTHTFYSGFSLDFLLRFQLPPRLLSFFHILHYFRSFWVDVRHERV